jgi:heme-degrading monooxygenase HmoA
MDRTLQQDPEHSYLYIWKFQVTPNKEGEFQRIYGPEGEWVHLFRQGAGYKQTLLLKDLDTPYSYTTVDMWESEAAYKHFKKEFAAEFETLDKHCEHLTQSEALVGRFEAIGQR